MDHVLALFVPGRSVAVHAIATDEVAKVGDLEGWTDAELDVLIEEGRRTFAGQASRFDRIRSTAQILLPTATALLVVLGSELRTVRKVSTEWLRFTEYGVWALGTVLVLLGLLGAASVLTARATFGAMLPTLLSQKSPPIKRVTAREYAGLVVVGEETVATRLTVIRDAVSLVIIGGLMHLALWIVSIF